MPSAGLPFQPAVLCSPSAPRSFRDSHVAGCMPPWHGVPTAIGMPVPQTMTMLPQYTVPNSPQMQGMAHFGMPTNTAQSGGMMPAFGIGDPQMAQQLSV